MGLVVTAKAKQWALTLLGLLVVYALFIPNWFSISEDELYYNIGSVFGAAAGAFLCGGIVAFILNLFWKSFTFFEFWFAISSIWLSIFALAKILNIN